MHEQQGAESKIEPSIVPKRSVFTHQSAIHRDHNPRATCDTTKLNTDPLDDAMQELLDICQQYNDRVSLESKTTMGTKNDNKLNPSGICYEQNRSKKMARTPCDMKGENSNASLDAKKQDMRTLSGCTDTGSIERLQQKQAELQSQLDEVLKVAKALDERQQRKSMRANYSDLCRTVDSNGSENEDEDELVEFEQIENELRISELNRKLDKIQEELRIRLYRRLMSKTTNCSKSSYQGFPSSARCGSHTDESSPSSSSCSDEPTASTSHHEAQSVVDERSKPEIDVEYNEKLDSMLSHSELNLRHEISISESGRSQEVQALEANSQDDLPKSCRSGQSTTSPNSANMSSTTQSDLDSIADKSPDDELLTSTTSKESIGSSKISSEVSNIFGNLTATSNLSITGLYNNTSPFCPSSNRNNSVNSDLERIEEDEEDCNDYYGNSDHFRTIYEEKLSPIMCAVALRSENHDSMPDCGPSATKIRSTITGSDLPDSKCEPRSTKDGKVNDGYTFGATETNSFKVSNSAKNTTNRPLTLYLPKPDEDIDLVEHIQALGHDTNMISDDLKLSPTNAHGFLWKSCSKNTKKWLKRYFYFDRNSKTLSYYENATQLVKRRGPPKCFITFDEIIDVYVDHKLSGLGERDRSSRRKNYVFVLVTYGRRYLLASDRAEIMRAWIDILFTAAKAHDYLQQLDSD